MILFFLVLLSSFSIAQNNSDTDSNLSYQLNNKPINPTNTSYKPHVVVAMIDTGINVYHNEFRRPNLTDHPSTYIEGIPSDATEINLTFSENYSYNVEHDKTIWGNIIKKNLYWFPHTNILGISFAKPTSILSYLYLGDPILDEYMHGTATSSVVSMINPNCTIVMIEAFPNTFKEALSWAVNQSWIDIIDIEFGVVYRPFIYLELQTQWSGIDEIYKQGMEKGKIIVTPTGNKPWVNTVRSVVSGPPEVISVGGAEDFCHGVLLTAAKRGDFVSSFTRLIAWYQNTSLYVPESGTSFSVPTVVGTISSIILNLREESNYTHGIINNSLIEIPEENKSIKNTDIRDVLNHTALYWKTSDWSFSDWIYKSPWFNATNPYTGEQLSPEEKLAILRVTFTVPVNPFAPWVQMGWGYVNESIVNETVDVLMGRKTMPEKPFGAVKYMESLYNNRKIIWS